MSCGLDQQQHQPALSQPPTHISTGSANKLPWRLKSSQFRRTLAWFIARRPGGSIAGAIQYRHLSIQMFEGYANPRELHQTGEFSQVAC